MNFTGKKHLHYLVKHRRGDLWHIYPEKGMLKHRIFLPPYHLSPASQLLIEEPVLDFDLYLDPGDYLHLTCLTKVGHLKYFIGQPGEKWNSTTLARFDVKSQLFRCLTLKVLPKRVHIFWATANMMNSFFWIIQQSCWMGREWKDDQVAEIIAGRNFPPFYLDCDSQGNLHLIYTSALGGKNYEAFYRKFNAEFNLWNFVEKNQQMPLNVQGICGLIDKNDTLHLVYTGTDESGGLQVGYQQRREITRSTTGKWEQHQVLHNCRQNCLQPLLLRCANRLDVVWWEGAGFVGCYSKDLGLSWSQAGQLGPLGFEPEGIVVFKYLTNFPAEVTRLKVPAIFGVAGKTISVIFNDKLKLVGPPAKIPDTFEEPQFKEVKGSDTEMLGSWYDSMEMACEDGRNLKEEAVHRHENPKGDERSVKQDNLKEEGVIEKGNWVVTERSVQNVVDETDAILGHGEDKMQKKEPLLQGLINELKSKLEQVKSSCEEGFIEQQKLQNAFQELKNQQDILTEEMIHLGEQLKAQKELFVVKKDEEPEFLKQLIGNIQEKQERDNEIIALLQADHLEFKAQVSFLDKGLKQLQEEQERRRKMTFFQRLFSSY